jgi:hypothetical protein
MYQTLIESDVVPHNSYIWKIKISLKVKVFLWLLYKEAILTKDNLVKRNWHGNEMCSFCSNDKIIQHIFFDGALAKFIWRLIYLVSGLANPNNIRHMFGAWDAWLQLKYQVDFSCWYRHHVVGNMVKP